MSQESGFEACALPWAHEVVVVEVVEEPPSADEASTKAQVRASSGASASVRQSVGHSNCRILALVSTRHGDSCCTVRTQSIEGRRRVRSPRAMACSPEKRT